MFDTLVILSNIVSTFGNSQSDKLFKITDLICLRCKSQSIHNFQKPSCIYLTEPYFSAKINNSKHLQSVFNCWLKSVEPVFFEEIKIWVLSKLIYIMGRFFYSICKYRGVHFKRHFSCERFLCVFKSSV